DAQAAELNLRLGWTLTFAGRLEEGMAAVERALVAGEALGLPELLSDALSGAAANLHFAGRPEQSRALDEAAARLAEREGLNHARMRALSNLGETLLARDDPQAEAAVTEALAIAGRLGNRGFEFIAGGNLMEVHLYRGRWGEVRRLAAELLDSDLQQPHTGYVHARLAVLEALSGDAEAATRQLAACAQWAEAEDVEDRHIHAATRLAVALAVGRVEEARDLGRAAARAAIADLGATHMTSRLAWPEALDAALAAGDEATGRELLDLLDAQPPGLLPRYLRAQRARGRGLLAGGREEAERELAAAVAAFGALGYPYWQARARLDLAGWLVEHDRAAEAAEPLEAATAALTELGAAPGLRAADALAARVPQISRA
ncbi:MAG TPA: hypothetical protein VGI54_05700, partial [Solirubrobacteraceae bacterium]